MSRSILEKLRRGDEQVGSHHNVERTLKEYSDAPTPHVDPFHHAILKKIQADINALYKKSPPLSFAGELQELDGRVTLSTLPTGQVNARTQVVPGTDEYLIVLDPVSPRSPKFGGKSQIALSSGDERDTDHHHGARR